MRRVLLVSAAALAMIALPLAAAAQTDNSEPYSSSTIPTTEVPASVDADGSGLTATFTAAGVTGDCTWDFGDDTTGTGNPVTHTYDAAGSYTATATCGAEVLGIVFVASADGLAQTGIDAALMATIALAAVAIGALLVIRFRRTQQD